MGYSLQLIDIPSSYTPRWLSYCVRKQKEKEKRQAYLSHLLPPPPLHGKKGRAVATHIEKRLCVEPYTSKMGWAGRPSLACIEKAEGWLSPPPFTLKTTGEGMIPPRFRATSPVSLLGSKAEREGQTLPDSCHVESEQQEDKKRKVWAHLLCPLHSSSPPPFTLKTTGYDPSPFLPPRLPAGSKTEREGQTLPDSCHVESEQQKRQKKRKCEHLHLS